MVSVARLASHREFDSGEDGMGVDFLKSKCQPFVKSWDLGRLNAAASNWRDAQSLQSTASVKTTEPSALVEADKSVVYPETFVTPSALNHEASPAL
jgi:hypothetical protein